VVPQCPVALAIGGNRGIGFEVCRQLGHAGMQVLLGARDPAKGETAAAALKEWSQSFGAPDCNPTLRLIQGQHVPPMCGFVAIAQ